MEHLIATYLAAGTLVGVYAIWMSVGVARLSRRLKDLETPSVSTNEMPCSKGTGLPAA